MKILKKAIEKLPDLPTDQVVKTSPVSGNLTAFVASSKYPSLKNAFQSSAITRINELSEYLNKVLFYSSTGSYDMNKLFQKSFNYSASDIPPYSKDLKYILLFCKDIYNIIYNSGLAYNNKFLDKETYLDKFNSLLKNQHLNNLSQVNPASELASKVSGNTKADIKNYLQLLINIAPTK
jgi:hypothetical protein